ncbi:MAG TPA: crosslink repair DNA glycosylase YcaQ family protein, partial [Capillimicrobium sp.]
MLTERALNRATLARQLLLERAELPALTALERLAGLQAQAATPPYVGLWTRLKGFDPNELSEAIEGREAVRLALMRGTIHVVAAADAAPLRGALAPLYAKFVRDLEGRTGGAGADD